MLVAMGFYSRNVQCLRNGTFTSSLTTSITRSSRVDRISRPLQLLWLERHRQTHTPICSGAFKTIREV